MDIAEFERKNFSVLGYPGPGGTLQSVEVVPPTIAHGSLYSINVPSAGTKTDYNDGNYEFAGHRHMHHKFTDFDTAETSVPALNTEAGWLAHLQGIKPIITSEDYNSESVESGATLELTGSPTVSGKWLKRQTSAAIAAAYPSNYRLRNWNLFSNTGYKGKGYMSCYFKNNQGDDTGKFIRIYWDKNNATYPKSWNIYTGKLPGNTSYSWRMEGEADGWVGAYADQNYSLDDAWQRHELFLDFDNDEYVYLVDGDVQTDVSNSYTGVVSGQLGAGRVLDYGLLGNTVDPRLEDGHSIGYAMPIWDFDSKRVEIADSDNWGTKTKSEPCPAVSWENDNIQFVINQGAFADLSGKHIFVLDGITATYAGALI